MRHRRYVVPALLAGLALVGSTGWAQQPTAQPPAAAPPPATAGQAEPEPSVQPQAVSALEAMGRYLRTLKTFQVTSTSTTDQVLDDGQLAETSKKVNLVARPPDRLLVQVDGDQGERHFLYDGQKVTVWSPDESFYAEEKAPPTIAQLADLLATKHGIDVPLMDLFRWGGPQQSQEPLQAARDLGPADVDGTSCEQYAFRQAGLDWQVWIQQGDYPLPRKLVLTTRTDEARPRHSTVLTWNLAPSVNDAAFTFVPPPAAKKVVLAQVPKTTRDTKESAR